MICMRISLPTSIKLPNRIVGCGVPVGTCSVPCAAAHEATARSTTPMSAIWARRFMPSPFSVFLLPVHVVHQRRGAGRSDKEGGHEAGADAPVEMRKWVCTSFLGGHRQRRYDI